MNWTKNRFDNLPLILAGPILRKVDYNSVSVFIALKGSQKVRLEIYDEKNDLIIKSSDTKPLKLGEKLYVITITAKAKTQFALFSEKLYKYNLFFNGKGMVSGDKLTEGILISKDYQFKVDKDNLGIGYGDYKYPSFLLPEKSYKNLKFVHGSCRKPHGGEVDALIALHKILDDTASKNLSERPQLLIFSGDQIYADDVADSLLYMIRSAAHFLLPWSRKEEEKFPVIGGKQDNFLPGMRQKVVAPEPDKVLKDKFTSAAAKSHLITLSEYYVMYLFIWSDVLWDEVLPLQKSDERELNQLKSFRKTLKYVRKALANIPSYMMFDDHDVTDDWYLSGEWVENTLGQNGMTKRILCNALSSFSIFQAWGNTPERFQKKSNGTDTKESKLLFLLSNVSNTISLDNFSEEISKIVLPNLHKSKKRLIGGLKWSYEIDFFLFRLIGMDTRTKRGFQSMKSFPNLLSSGVLKSTLKIASRPKNFPEDFFALIISPAPVIGNYLIEIGQEKILQPLTGLYKFDNESWSESGVFEDLLDVLSEYKKVVLLSGDVHQGYSNCTKYFNNRNPNKKNATIIELCSSALKNSNGGSLGYIYNDFFKPSEVRYLGWKEPGTHLQITETFVTQMGMTRVSKSRDLALKSQKSGFKHAIFVQKTSPRLREITKIYNQPDWEYFVRFARDERKRKTRYLESAIEENMVQIDYKDRDIHSSRYPSGNPEKVLRKVSKLDYYKLIVGKDNIGVVQFEEENNQLTLIHKFYLKLYGREKLPSNFHPVTIHKLNFNEPNDSDKAFSQ